MLKNYLEVHMKNSLTIIGVQMDFGQSRRGVNMGPSAIRYAGLVEGLEHMGFTAASEMIRKAILTTIADKTVTPDLAANMPGAHAVTCSAYGKALLANMERM